MAPVVAWLTLYRVPRFGLVIHHPIPKNRVFFCPLDSGPDLIDPEQQETVFFSEANPDPKGFRNP
jgi:hypothetical protein